jgi:hypothetical protein
MRVSGEKLCGAEGSVRVRGKKQNARILLASRCEVKFTLLLRRKGAQPVSARCGEEKAFDNYFGVREN